MVAESHPRRLGITERDAAARSIGWDSRRLRRTLAPAIVRIRIRSPRWQAATTEQQRQEQHRQDDREIEQPGEIYAAGLSVPWHP
jgi:hypothetical protein